MVIRLAYRVKPDFKQVFDLVGFFLINDFDNEVVVTIFSEDCLG